MTTQRHHREPFRHARRSIRGRIGRLSLISAAAIGVAAVAALPASQAFSAAMGVRTDPPPAVNMSATQGQSPLGVAASAAPKAEAAMPAATKPTTAKSKPVTTSNSSPKSKPTATKTAPPAKKELSYTYEAQINGWYCGPAAARNALTTRGLSPSQDELANQMGTTTNGTNSAEDITRVLNAVTKTSFYHTTSIPTKGVTQQQINQLRADVVHAISKGYGVVANIVGDAQDVNGGWYSFGGGHYIAVVGYQANGQQVKIADSADSNRASYWMTVSNLAEWIGSRGYAS